MVFQKRKNTATPAQQRLICFVIGIIMIGVSIYFIFFQARNIVLECTRLNPTTGQCTLKEEFLLNSTTKIIPVVDLLDSRVDSKQVRTKGGLKTESQIVLITKNEQIPLSTMYSRDQQLITNNQAKLSVFIKYQDQAFLKIQDDEKSKYIIIGSIMFGFALVSLIMGLFIRG
ncbi:MAG: hypothetical protein AB7V50_05895 [Vampirovibrionia bacterium]